VKPVEDMQVEATVDEFIDFVEHYSNTVAVVTGQAGKAPGTRMRPALDMAKTMFLAQRQMKDIFDKYAADFGDSDGPDDAVPAAV
jgi:hypothetical protein